MQLLSNRSHHFYYKKQITLGQILEAVAVATVVLTY